MAAGQPSKALIAEGFYTYKKQAGDGLCWVRSCRNQRRPDRCMCSKHYQRRWRSLNPVTSDFCNLREHAKARKLEFNISLDYWLGLTDAFSFYTQKNPNNILTIDRVDASKGYVVGNMRIVELAINVAKGNKERHLPEHVQAVLQRKREQEQATNAKHLACDPPITDEIEYSEPPEYDDINPF